MAGSRRALARPTCPILGSAAGPIIATVISNQDGKPAAA
jgi:hypothetical protein